MTATFTPQLYVRAYAGLKIIEGTRQGWDFVVRVLADYPLPVVLNYLAKVNLVLEGPGARHDVGKQTFLIERSCQGTIIDRIREKSTVLDGPPPMVLFHEAQVFVAARVALIYCKDRASKGTPAGLDDLVRALLAINDNFDDHPRPGEAKNDWLMRALFPSMVFAQDGEWRYEAARWEELLRVIPARLPRTADTVDYEELFHDATECGLDEYRAMVAAFLATHSHIESGDTKDPNVPLDLQHLFRDWFLSPEDRKVIALVARDAETMRREFKDAAPAVEYPYYFVPFYNHPVVSAAGLSWILSKRLLENKLGSGIYHVIFSHLLDKWRSEAAAKADAAASSTETEAYVKAKVKQFRGFLGKTFHVYVRDMLTRALGDSSHSKLVDIDTVALAGDRSRCDFLILDGPRAILVECKSRFLTLRSAATGDVQSIKKDYRMLAVGSSMQVDRTAVDIEQGVLHLDGVKPEQVNCYLPLVVTLDFVPAEHAMYNWLEDEVAEARRREFDAGGAESDLLRRKVFPLQIIDVGTLELLEPLLSSTRLSDLLDEKNIEPTARAASFSNFLAWKELHLDANAHLEEVFVGLVARWQDFWQARLINRRDETT